MTTPQKSLPFYLDVDGFRVPGYFGAEGHRSAVAYKPRPDDLFIVAFPKSGTTWIQNILACIFNKGEPFSSVVEFLNRLPVLHLTGAKAIEIMRRPGALKIHVPFHMIPYHPQAKYIFVARNPKDCCVSFYNHTKSIPGYKFLDGQFDDYFELFIKGETDFGDYFDILLSWYEHRKDPNVFFLTYEQLKENPRKYILEMAEFLDSTYRDEMEKDPQLLEKVVSHSSFNYAKEALSKSLKELSSCPPEDILNNPDITENVKKMFITRDWMFSSGAVSSVFVRKGVVGGWKNYFSKEQSERMDAKFNERTKGTNIPELWKDYM